MMLFSSSYETQFLMHISSCSVIIYVVKQTVRFMSIDVIFAFLFFLDIESFTRNIALKCFKTFDTTLSTSVFIIGITDFLTMCSSLNSCLYKLVENVFSHEPFRSKFLLRGSLLTKYYIENSSAKIGNVPFRQPQDLDLMYVDYSKDVLTLEEAHEWNMQNKKRDPPSPGWIDEYNKSLDELVKVITESNPEDEWIFPKESLMIVRTWIEDPYPSVKIKMMGCKQAGCEVIPMNIDVNCGDPIIGPVETLCFPANISIPCAPLATLVSWKLNSCFENKRWRPKDTYDLSILLTLIEYPSPVFLSSVSLAFVSRGNDWKKEFLDKCLNFKITKKYGKAWKKSLVVAGIINAADLEEEETMEKFSLDDIQKKVAENVRRLFKTI